MFDVLLTSLPEEAKTFDQVGVWADKDTLDMARPVPRWRTLRNVFQKTSPTEQSFKQNWAFAIVTPVLGAERLGVLDQSRGYKGS